MTVTSMEAIPAIALITDIPVMALAIDIFVIVLSLKSPFLDNSFLLLESLLYIYYPLQFKKDPAKVLALLDSSSEVNAKTPAYAAKLGFKVQLTNINNQNIDGSTLENFGIVLASF